MGPNDLASFHCSNLAGPFKVITENQKSVELTGAKLVSEDTVLFVPRIQGHTRKSATENPKKRAKAKPPPYGVEEVKSSSQVKGQYEAYIKSGFSINFLRYFCRTSSTWGDRKSRNPSRSFSCVVRLVPEEKDAKWFEMEVVESLPGLPL